MSELLFLIGVLCIAFVPAYIGLSMLSLRAKLVDIAGWGYSLVPPAFFLGVLFSTWFDAVWGAALGIAVTVATLFPSFIFHRVRRMRFFVVGVSPSQVETIQKVVEDSTGRVGSIRRDSRPPQFGASHDFVVGPAERLSGAVWLGFERPLSATALRGLRNSTANEISAVSRRRSFGVAVGFLLTSALCFALFSVYFGVAPFI